jgi:hypothetical protein
MPAPHHLVAYHFGHSFSRAFWSGRQANVRATFEAATFECRLQKTTFELDTTGRLPYVSSQQLRGE